MPNLNASESYTVGTTLPGQVLWMRFNGMTLIRELVQKALKTGYLTIEAEEQLRQLLTSRYDLEDLNAFMTLQEAAMAGRVKQESRERQYAPVEQCL